MLKWCQSKRSLSYPLATPVSGSSSQTAPRMAGGQHGLSGRKLSKWGEYAMILARGFSNDY